MFWFINEIIFGIYEEIKLGSVTASHRDNIICIEYSCINHTNTHSVLMYSNINTYYMGHKIVEN